MINDKNALAKTVSLNIISAFQDFFKTEAGLIGWAFLRTVTRR